MYRTGDAARFAHTGTLEFVGRTDQQVKLRGFRVELGEIEAHLAQLASVEACAVKLLELAPGDARLVGYVVPRQPHPFDATGLKRELRRHVPDYMVPSLFVAMGTLPLTPNGKIDRKALPVPEAERPLHPGVAGDAYEALVCASFAQVLGLSKVGLSDNFFDLGGHSLLAVRLFDRLHELSSVRLPLATLFQASTPADLAALIRTQAAPTTPRKGARIRRLSAGEAPPELLFLVRAGETEEAELARYGALAAALDRPAVALTFELDADLTLLELAARCAEQAQSLKPVAPLTLVGRGVAGNLAQELAVQLEHAGQVVDHVVLLDSLAHVTFAAPTLAYLKAVPRNALRALSSFAGLPSHQRLPHLQHQAARLGMYLTHMLDSDLPGFLPDPVTDFDNQALPLAYSELVPSEWQTLGLHAARACRAPILLLRGRRRGLLPRASDSGWGELTQAVVQSMVVDHASDEALSSALLAALHNLRS
jgi:hypothetical protein